MAPIIPGACESYILDVVDIECDANDALEPNEDIAGAVPLPAPGQTLQIQDAVDEDFFSVLVPAGERVELAIRFRDDDGDIDARLLDAAGNSLDAGLSISDDELVDWLNDTGVDQEIFLRVYLFPSSVDCGNVYTVEVL